MSSSFNWGFALLSVAILSLSSCDTFKSSRTTSTKDKVPTSYNTPTAPKPMSNLEARKGYIERFKRIAISEMERTGVPASIKLAQGLLESDAGRSVLSSNYNNHFGIKCHSDWQGERYYKEDDDKDPLTGQLIKSCFRVYKNPDESFVAHSEFLRDPRKVNRYGFLFNLPKNDYVGWAEGLERAGYATATDYSEKLVKIIEDFQLSQYDNLSLKDVASNINNGSGSRPNDDFPVSGGSGNTNKPNNNGNNSGNNSNGSWIPGWENAQNEQNGVDQKPQDTEGVRNNTKYARSYGNMTPYELAGKYGISIANLQEYNEELPDPRTPLPEGTLIYLQKKRNYWTGNERSYRVKDCETMYDISQKFGVKLSKLYSKNEMRQGEQPAVGQIILLRRGWFQGAEKPALRDTFGEWRRCNPDMPASTNPSTVNNNPNQPSNNQGGVGFDITPINNGNNGGQASPINNPPYYQPPSGSTPVETYPSSGGTTTYPSTTTEYPSYPSYPSSGGTTTTYPSNNKPSTTYKPSTPATTTKPTTPTPTKPVTTPTTKPTTTPAGAQYHTVAQSETLWAISRKYGLTVDKLKELNGLTDNIIKPGQQLRVK
ncbi:MAG: LysM peptidoglycan-binding domain-containing protein [Saprospiraceae bacterium]|nr:LysM peptidoglycan-binding domain-containing protein [Saprospiraceae bacterium]